MHKKSKVVCILPRAGLGNQLFPLMNALVFSKLNDLDVIIIGYHQVKIGPYLRKEKIKRAYIGYFNFQKNILKELYDKVRVWLLYMILEKIQESKIEKLDTGATTGKIFVFKNLPTYFDYFIHLKDHRVQVRQLLYSILKVNIKEEIFKLKQPVIGVHIRMGDFRKLEEGEDFSKVGHVRTPENYFIELIKTIRKINNHDLPVTIFTDGYKHEFDKIFDLGNVELSEWNSDIADLILLSKSQILITANGSTFSYWAAFLSDAAIIKHPDHLYAPFRPANVNRNSYEGPLIDDQIDKLLEQNIKSISAKN